MTIGFTRLIPKKGEMCTTDAKVLPKINQKKRENKKTLIL